MLLVVSLDSENEEWLRGHMDNGDLPNLSALASSSTLVEVNAVQLSGLAYPTFYTGRRPADLGFYFPVQWEPSEQRMVEWTRLSSPETLFEQLEKAGKRIVVLDPPECRPFPLKEGYCLSGLQFRTPVLLSSWSSDSKRTRELLRPIGPAHRADEVFGPVSASHLAQLRSALLRAPARLSTVARACITQDQPDCLWVTCCALHMAGHQFFHLPSIQDSRLRAELEGTRLELAKAYDQMIGSLIEVLPGNSRVLVMYAKGMGHVTAWPDLLPAMLQRILGQRKADQPVTSVRRLLPVSIRRWASSSMSDRRVLQVMARLSTPRTNWNETRAFCLPTDCPGLIRFNVAGREKDGIVGHDDVRGLAEEIRDGLQTFTDFDGAPCVQSVRTPESIVGKGSAVDRFPDLIIEWMQRPGSRSDGVRSGKFGELRRGSEIVGRSGNHCPGAFTILSGGNQESSPPDRRMEVEDIPATVIKGLGLSVHDLPGQSFWN